MNAAPANEVGNQTDQQLAQLFQYTIEAYKIFQKLGETLPNPMAAQMFAKFAVEEREHRDLIEIRHLGAGGNMRATLAGDARFLDVIDKDLAPRELIQSLILRERTMEKKLAEVAGSSAVGDRLLFTYIAGSKRGHAVLLERELEMLAIYPDWFKREDAESLVGGRIAV